MSGALPMLVEQLSARVAAPLDARLIAQALVGAMFGLIDGLGDADRNRPPYLWFDLHASGWALPKALLSKAGAAAKVLALCLAIEATDQYVTTGLVDLGEAVVIVLALGLAPYALLRSVVTGLATQPPDEL